MLLELVRYLTNRKKGHGISILVPFHCPNPNNQRAKNWRWLKRYWEYHLPGAEMIIGKDQAAIDDPDIPFSKSVAVNDAASRAKGDIFVIVDADGYISIESVLHCAKKIREALRKGRRLWYVPYRRFFRLTKDASWKVLRSDPRKHPYKFPHPPHAKDVQSTDGSQHGHWYGAMIQIMPAEAFWEVGGWDERFRGWGGEDHAAMRAMDTLYWRHKTMPDQVLHLWHPMFQPTGESQGWVDWNERVWANQRSAGANTELSNRYYGAYGDQVRMRKLVDEGLQFKMG